MLVERFQLLEQIAQAKPRNRAKRNRKKEQIRKIGRHLHNRTQCKLTGLIKPQLRNGPKQYNSNGIVDNPFPKKHRIQDRIPIRLVPYTIRIYTLMSAIAARVSVAHMTLEIIMHSVRVRDRKM